MAIDVKTIWKLIKETFTRWNDDKVPRLGAALSYYTLFSLAPILIIVISLAGLIFGREAVEGQLISEIGGLVGRASAEAIQDIVRKSSEPAESMVATVIGIVTLLIGATGVFVELQDALNTIWGVKPKPGRGIMGLVKDRLLSFALILGVGFLLLVSLVISAALTALNTYLEQMPGMTILWSSLSFVISFGVVTVLFAMIYKVLPDVKIAWSDVWIGAAVTALLFTLGKFLIGLYLGQSTFASTYGAAGSIVVLLVWVYYSTQLLFFGAEFTQVYANYFGSHVVPADNAIPTVQVCVQEEVLEAGRNVDLTKMPKKVVVDEEGRPKEDSFADTSAKEAPTNGTPEGDTAAGGAAGEDHRSRNGTARPEPARGAGNGVAAGVVMAESLSVDDRAGSDAGPVSADGSSSSPADGARVSENDIAGDLLAFADHDGASWATHPPVEEVIVIEVRPRET